jgi:hypothetical protein
MTKRDATFKLSGDLAYRMDITEKTDTGDINVLSAYPILNGNSFEPDLLLFFKDVHILILLVSVGASL